jgi:uncharacterized protein (TIGR02453 family)
LAKTAHFTPKFFKFLRELKKNNNRNWFQANKQRYESEVRDPMLAFIADVGSRLRKISPRIVADPRPNGGSMFRIYRDVRFSPNKQPYKTNAAARFPHAMGREIQAPGFYLHIEPGMAFAAGGIWHPDAPTLAKIREAIVDDSTRWKRMLADKKFRARCSFDGDDRLTRPPRGYDPDHPMIEDLKRKNFACGADFKEADALSPAFIDRFTDFCAASAPLMRFLTDALDLKW